MYGESHRGAVGPSRALSPLKIILSFVCLFVRLFVCPSHRGAKTWEPGGPMLCEECVNVIEWDRVFV